MKKLIGKMEDKKMKKFIFPILALSALIMVACNKEISETDQIAEEEPGVEYEFTATLDDPQPETEASIGYTTDGQITWNSNDEIAVWNASTNSFVTFKVKELSNNNHTATFNATLSGTPSFGKAYYPASIAGTSETSVVMPSSYGTAAAAADGFPMMSNTVVPGQPVTFKHLGTPLQFKITGVPSGATQLVITSSDASLAGTFTANYNNGEPTLTASAGTASVTVPVSSGDNTIYVPLPSGRYNVEFIVKNASGRNLYRRASKAASDFNRAILRKLNATYIAPSKYYVKTVSNSGYWDGDHIMLQGSANVYEVWVNCDGGTTSYIYDEYNIGNDVTGVGSVAHSNTVGDANKYKIEYNTSTRNAAMTYIRGTQDYPYGWNNLYTAPLYLHGSWDGSNWTDSNFAAYDNGTRANHVFEASLTTTATTGEFGLKASNDWWSASTNDANYGTITAGASGIYYCTLVKESNDDHKRNQKLTNLPAGTYKVYANILNDDYGDRPIRVMFVKQ